MSYYQLNKKKIINKRNIAKSKKKERVFWVTVNQVKQLRKIYQKYFT